MKINEDLIRFHGEELINTLVRKNQDYGNSVQEQFEEYGLTSILIRLDDKMRRLKHLRTHNPQVAEESLQDTLKDLSGYALLGLMCLQHQEQEETCLDDLPVIKIPANFERVWGEVFGVAGNGRP